MKITRSNLELAVMIAVFCCIMARLVTLGLLGLLLVPLYVIVCALHIVIHLHLLKRRVLFSRAALSIIFVSHGLLLLAFLALTCGLILDTVTRGRREMKRLHYLALAAPGEVTSSSA